MSTSGSKGAALDERFRVEGRRVWYETVKEMQKALDRYMVHYRTERAHKGRHMDGKTPKANLPNPMN